MASVRALCWCLGRSVIPGPPCFHAEIHSVNNCGADEFHVIIAGIQTVDTEDCLHRSTVCNSVWKGHLCALYLHTSSVGICFGDHFHN